MGTKAVFAISDKKVLYSNEILAFFSDGFPENLKILAADFLKLVKSERVLGKIKKLDPETIHYIFSKLEKSDSGGAFVDNLKNACWVSYSLQLNVEDNTAYIYEGNFERLIQTEKIV